VTGLAAAAAVAAIKELVCERKGVVSAGADTVAVVSYLQPGTT